MHVAKIKNCILQIYGINIELVCCVQYMSCGTLHHVALHVSWQLTPSGMYYTSHATPRLMKIKIFMGSF